MRLKPSRIMMGFKSTASLLICVLLLQGCFEIKNTFTYARKKSYPGNTAMPFLFQTSISLNGGNFTADERTNITQKLYTQLDDSARVNINDRFFIFHKVVDPPVFDTAYSNRSAANMKNYLLHLGYNRATDSIKIDTIAWGNQRRVTVQYFIDAGTPTLIDTFRYLLKIPDLQNLAQQSKQKSFIVQSKPVTKIDVLSEISRLVDTFRNNGYYKFTSDELRMRGDSSIEALRNTSDDPLENLTLLAEANEQRDKPTVKLALLLNPAADSTHLKKYYINNVFIYPDFAPEDASIVATFNEAKDSTGNIIRYHKNIIQNNFLSRYIFLKKGKQYSQELYSKTVNGFAAIGVWQNVNVQFKEIRDSLGLLDVYIQLVPAKKYGFEAKLEASYSVNSNSNNVSIANAGNLLGLSGNLSLQNRNVGKRGIKMTNSVRAGVELNLNAARSSAERINSNEFSFSNTISVPKVVPNFFLKWLKKQQFYKEEKNSSQQTFFNTTYSNTNRIGLFKLNSLGFNMGYEFVKRNGRILTFKPFNIEYTNLYGRTAAFDQTLKDNPFLRYSFNTALVIGSAFGYSSSHINKANTIGTLKINVEESGFLLPGIPLGGVSAVQKDLRQYAKFDIERTLNYSFTKSSVAVRFFGGVGVPIGNSDTTLPFFKQYFAGGANSMRAWPVRGLGPGSKKLAPYDRRTFADRTGDVRLEANIEYRRTLFQIIPNSLTLKWALFADIGNIWNVKNTQPGGGFDSAQFKLNLRDFYKELGVTAGAGLRFDFNYVLLRIDLGFRFKRPELSENNGWKAPSIGFDDLYSKIFRKGDKDEFRRWRYENFNFSIGLSYPF